MTAVRHLRVGALLAAGAAAGMAACVAIETAPGGVQSVRFDAAPPSIVTGDVLRDSAGRPTTLNAVAFDEDGRPVTNPRVRYAYVAVADTTGTGLRDTALVVDSMIGAVRATAPLRRAQGRVATVVGDRLQLVQTFEVVVAPDSQVPAADTINVLRYDCTDTRTTVRQDTGTGTFQYNAVALPSVTVRGVDTLRTRVGIRARLVRWDVDSGFWPFPGGRAPRVALTAGGRDSVPVIGIIDGAGTTPVLQPFDSTTSAGVSTARLHIRPYALGHDVVAAREFTVRVRVRGQPGPAPLANDPLYFRVRLVRTTTPVLGATPTCP